MVATGASYDQLAGTEAAAARLRRVRLQMLETAPLADRLTTALADADTLRYYPAYEVAPLSLLGEQGAVAAAHHLQLLVVQRPDGGLTIGDTHAYEEPFDFALCEDPTEELLGRARRILGTELPPVRRRWEGVYAQCLDGAVCLREEIRPGGLAGDRPRRAGDDLCAGHRRRHAGGRRGPGVIGRYALACLDMAGTTVRDDGAVEAAFARARPPSGSPWGAPATNTHRASCAPPWDGRRPTCSPSCSSPGTQNGRQRRSRPPTRRSSPPGRSPRCPARAGRAA